MAYYTYVKDMTQQGQKKNAVTVWAHCQRQVAFFGFKSTGANAWWALSFIV